MSENGLLGAMLLGLVIIFGVCILGIASIVIAFFLQGIAGVILGAIGGGLLSGIIVPLLWH